MVIKVATNLNKIELEKNNFIRKLSREQFDGVITNKYKKVFMDYFNGNINDSELAERINKNLELVNVYENGDSGKIDSNQYLYSAIVEVALNYYNVANGFETCINKMNLFASYFQALIKCSLFFFFVSLNFVSFCSVTWCLCNFMWYQSHWVFSLTLLVLGCLSLGFFNLYSILSIKLSLLSLPQL